MKTIDESKLKYVKEIASRDCECHEYALHDTQCPACIAKELNEWIYEKHGIKTVLKTREK